MKLVYKGPHDAVEVALPNGASVVVPRDGSADFGKEIAESLLGQGDDHWRKANGGSK